jgi:signal transduction histidine kinase
MIGEFRNYGKPIQLEKVQYSINQIIRDEVWYAKPEGFIIEDAYDDAVPDFFIDKARFAESIKELLSNARKALYTNKVENGIVKVSTKLLKKEHCVLLRIEDNGPGFPPNFQVFEPFNSTDPQSTGLGLATVKELIEAHDGTIEIGVSTLGGACIECVLPILQN